jgi:hypothetical protein
MANRVGLYFKTGALETGGAESLTGKIIGGSLISLADAETNALALPALATAYTLYYKVIDGTTLDDPGMDTSTTFTITAAPGTTVCATWNGVYGASCVVPAATGLYKPVFFKRTNAATVVSTNAEVGTGGLLFAAGTRVGGVTTASLSSSGTQIIVSWGSVTNAIGYHVQYKRTSDSTWIDASGNTTSPYTITSLIQGTSYDVRVRALGATGIGAWSSIITDTPTAYQVVDAGFEGRAHQGALDTSIWYPMGVNQTFAYDTSIVKVGSASMKIRGSIPGNTGVYEVTTSGGDPVNGLAPGLWHDGAEIVFWKYHADTLGNALFDDLRKIPATQDGTGTNTAAADRVFSVYWTTSGEVQILTDRTVTGYTPAAGFTTVGTYIGGWTQWRIKIDFTNQTYTLAKRLATTDTWTLLKSASAPSFDIPFRGVNTVSKTHGMLMRSRDADFYIDDLKYVDGDTILVDNGFEGTLSTPSVDGTDLAPGIWASSGTPQRREYDTLRSAVGTRSAWIQGPVAASTSAGVSEALTVNMSKNGSALQFWAYLDSTNQIRDVFDNASVATDRVFTLQWASNGELNVRTERTVTGYTPGLYTPVGTYSVGWMQYRIVFDFSTQIYLLFQRSSESNPWTPLKAAGAADYLIPMRGTGVITKTNGCVFRGYTGVNLWIDHVEASNNGLLR